MYVWIKFDTSFPSLSFSDYKRGGGLGSWQGSHLVSLLPAQAAANLIRELASPCYHVLLCNVALHVAVGVFILKELGESGVLGVSIQSHHMLVVTAQLGQSHAVRLPRSNLVTRGQSHNQSTTRTEYFLIYPSLSEALFYSI